MKLLIILAVVFSSVVGSVATTVYFNQQQPDIAQAVEATPEPTPSPEALPTPIPTSSSKPQLSISLQNRLVSIDEQIQAEEKVVEQLKEGMRFVAERQQKLLEESSKRCEQEGICANPHANNDSNMLFFATMDMKIQNHKTNIQNLEQEKTQILLSVK